jgi:hypothetical protein
VFVTQLQVKATERDVKTFFGAVCKVAEVALIQVRFLLHTTLSCLLVVEKTEDSPLSVFAYKYITS